MLITLDVVLSPNSSFTHGHRFRPSHLHVLFGGTRDRHRNERPNSRSVALFLREKSIVTGCLKVRQKGTVGEETQWRILRFHVHSKLEGNLSVWTQNEISHLMSSGVSYEIRFVYIIGRIKLFFLFMNTS